MSTGILHFGPGAFHRAHQADYIDQLLHHDPRWGIAAVSLRSAATIERLRRQQGLYTLAVLDAETSYRTIGAHNLFFGPGDRRLVRQALQDSAIRLVTSTVTEKGYCLASDGSLDFSHPDIVHDLANPHHPVSIVGWLALGLADRRSAGTAPFTPVCCDNMVANGTKLGRAVADYARRTDPDFAKWIEAEVRFPDTMVDSITPATDEHLLDRVRSAGFDDEIPVSREAYAQWVIQNVLPPGGPDLASVGVTVTDDVAAWEKAKLRILNGSHSTLAYIGLLLGHETVADAMGDQRLASFVRQLVADDIIPSLQPSTIDLGTYAAGIMQRFRNPSIRHKLSQIAWDGSQKLPYRLLDTVAEALNAGRSVERLALPIAAWMHFIVKRDRENGEIIDPIADQLRASAKDADPMNAFLNLRQIFPQNVADHPLFASAVRAHWQELAARGPAACL